MPCHDVELSEEYDALRCFLDLLGESLSDDASPEVCVAVYLTASI